VPFVVIERNPERLQQILERGWIGVAADASREEVLVRVGIARAIVLNPKYLFCDEPNSGLDPQTSMVIDKLIQEITVEYNITTVVNTHDMNSVMETGDHIIYMYEGLKEWEGSNQDIIFSKNEKLNKFIFASNFLQDAKDMRMLEAKGKIDNNRNMDELLK